jgi:hypothetical protein
MVSSFLVILSLVFLYLSKAKLSTEFSRLIHRFGGSRNSLIVLWSIVFLPGTVIHEMSHFLFAMVTGARTGKIEIFPRFLEEDWEKEEENTGVILGSVQTQKLNLVQGFLVGTAPFVVGITLLIWLAAMIQVSFNESSIYLLLFQGYLFFTVSNSFFPSWTDIKQVIPLVVVILVAGILFWLIGIKVILSPNPQVTEVSNMVSSVAFISTGLNIIIILLLWLLRRAFSHHR